MSDIGQIPAKHGTRYGLFRDASIAQRLKRAMGDGPNWARLPSHKREALGMIPHKIDHIFNVVLSSTTVGMTFSVYKLVTDTIEL